MNYVETAVFNGTPVERLFHSNLDEWNEACFKQATHTWKEAQQLASVDRDEIGMVDYRHYLKNCPLLRPQGIWNRVNHMLNPTCTSNYVGGKVGCANDLGRPFDFDASQWTQADSRDLWLGQGKFDEKSVNFIDGPISKDFEFKPWTPGEKSTGSPSRAKKGKRRGMKK